MAKKPRLSPVVPGPGHWVPVPGVKPSRRPDDRAVGPRSTGKPSKNDRASNLHGLSPRQIQKLLRSRGYIIAVDGIMGPETKAAMQAYINGKTPQQYNKGRGGVAGRVVSGAKAAAGAAAAGAKAVGGKVGKGKNTKPSTLQQLAAAGANVGMYLPETSADELAGLEYDPQINDAKRLLEKLGIQGPQNLHDIGHWYDQVLGSQATAASRDHDISEAGKASVSDAVQKIIASVGGGANEGAGLIGAAGADAVGMLGALGTTQDQYNQDIRPILQAESAGASTREKARQSQENFDLHGKIRDLIGAKGAKTAEELLNIRDKNNALEQTRFQNQLALEQTRQAGLMTGAKIAAVNQPKPISPNALSSAAGDAVMAFTSKDEDGNPVVSTKGRSVQQVVQMVNDAYRAAGLDIKNPQVAYSAMAVLRRLGITPDPHWYK